MVNGKDTESRYIGPLSLKVSIAELMPFSDPEY